MSGDQLKTTLYFQTTKTIRETKVTHFTNFGDFLLFHKFHRDILVKFQL